MPQVPVYGPRKVGIEPVPAARLTAQNTPASEGALKWTAIGRFGATVADLGDVLIDRAMQQAFEADQLNIQKVLNDYEYESLVGPDGLLTKKGMAPTEQLQSTLDSFEGYADDFATTIKTQRGRDYFAEARERTRASVLARGSQYAATERAAYLDEVTKGFTASAMNKAISASTEPDAIPIVVEQLNAIHQALVAQGERNGSPPEIVEAAELELFTTIHEQAIDRLLAKDQPNKARAWYEEFADAGQIGGTATARIETKLANGSVKTEAMQGAAEILAMFPSINDQDPFERDKMGAEAFRRYKDKFDVYEQVSRLLDARMGEVNAGRAQREDARQSQLWSAVFNGQSLAAIMRTDAYTKSDPETTQKGIRDYLAAQARQAEDDKWALYTRQRARIGDAREDELYKLGEYDRQQKALEDGYAAEYWNTITDPNFHLQTEGQLLAELPRLGPVNVKKLLTELQKQQADAAHRGTVNLAQFNQLMAEGGDTKIYAPPSESTEEERAARAKVLQTVIDEITRQEQGGKRLTEEQKDLLMKGIIDQKVYQRRLFGLRAPLEYTIAGLPKTSGLPRSSLYIPVDRLPQAGLDESVRRLRIYEPSITATLDRQGVINTFRTRIEHAAGIEADGATDQEIEDVLRGK